MSDRRKKKREPQDSAKEWEPDNEQIRDVQADERSKKNRFTGESNK